jgi:hypothetical protein
LTAAHGAVETGAARAPDNLMIAMIPLAVLGISFIVILHELGHYLAAREHVLVSAISVWEVAMLAATALENRAAIITPDERIRSYPHVQSIC